MHTRIKVCGITTLRDAEICAELGVDFLGLIFAESPRSVDISVASRIARRLHGKTAIVGVFAEYDAKVVNQTVKEVKLDFLQVYFNYDQPLPSGLPLPLIASIWMDEGASILPMPGSEYLLLDFKRPGALNGQLAGQWDKLRTDCNVILAGGIDADNVVEIVRRYEPFGIDTARGTESSPGVKDHAKIEKLVERVRSCSE